MLFIERELAGPLRKAAANFPAVVLTGPRRAGKTVLLKKVFPDASYHLFEAPDLVARFRADPVGFLDGVHPPAILDEIQHVPELFAYLRARIDAEPRRTGRWFLTGSQEAGLMQNVTESMAGRAAVLQLLPLSSRETDKVTMLRGGYPEVIARPRAASMWFASYVQTYLERDVRLVTAVQDLATFRRFLGLVASRHGQILTKSGLAAPLGLSIPTITRWLDVLETTGQILVVHPYFENFGKRLVKSPRVFIGDSGLACHLLGIESEAELAKSPFRGELFEGLLAAEILKAQVNRGERRQLWYFRDHAGLEVDFVMPGRGDKLRWVEAKATRTPRPAMAEPMRKLLANTRDPKRARDEMFVVHEAPLAGTTSQALAPGVRAMPWRDFLRDGMN
ncbi:MAG: ATP-binding protein [Planctomycetes bacterium]|nr:ATP-binding protein [Planctomycetota bacterium]